MRRKHKKKFWKNFKFKYKLTITNENTLEEVVALYVSKLNGLSVLLTLAFVLFLIAACILVFTPLKNYLPGYMNSDVRREAVINQLRVDSLVEGLERQHLYLSNLRDILSGHVKVDTVSSIDSLATRKAETMAARTKEEELFRENYEASGMLDEVMADEVRTIEGVRLVAPIRGTVGTAFNPPLHQLGCDIRTGTSTVTACLDGTVVMSVFIPGRGNVIQIQHNQGFMSVYSNCSEILKRAGDRVLAGEAIAHLKQPLQSRILHFELWYNGVPLDPERYIVF